MKSTKKICSAALLIFLSALLAVPVFAVDAGKSTLVIDGEKDAAYDQSYSFNIFDQENVDKGDGWYSTFGDTSTSMDAKVYYMWDDSFLYAFVEVQTEKLTDAGQSYIVDSDNPWESEAVELWLLWTDLDDSSERLKISVEPFYNKSWGDGPYYEEVAAESKAVAKVTDKGYNAEFAVKIPASYLKQGNKIKATLQVNDHSDAGTVAVGQQIAADGNNAVDFAPVFTLGAAIAASQTAPEPVAAETPQPEPTAVVENVSAAPVVTATATAPQTSDGTIMMLAIFALSGAGLTIAFKNKSSKNKKKNAI